MEIVEVVEVVVEVDKADHKAEVGRMAGVGRAEVGTIGSGSKILLLGMITSKGYWEDEV